MTRLFHVGGETGNLNEFSTTNGQPQSSTTQKLVGTRSIRNQVSSGFSVGNINPYATDQSLAGWARAYVFIATAPTVTIDIFGFIQVSGGTKVAYVKLTNARTFQLFKADNTQLGSASAAIALNEWNLIEIKNDASINPGTIEARLNETSFASGSNSSRGAWRGVEVGNGNTSTTFDTYWDEIVAHDDGWPGPIVVIPNKKQLQRPKMFAPGLAR